MTRIELTVTGAEANARVSGPLTGGMVGIPVVIRYDSAWDGLSKTLVCRSCLDGTRQEEARTIVNVGTEATVAHEVMIAGRMLYLGIEGRNSDGTEVYPTIWACCGEIQPGANADADPTVEATPEAWEQILVQVGDLEGLNTESKENLVAAVNEVMGECVGIESITANHSDSHNATLVAITMTDGTVKQFTVPDGEDGADGVGIASITIEHWDGYDYTAGLIVLTDGTDVPFTIPDGKSAYAYAVEAGYGGTEEEFAKNLAVELVNTEMQEYSDVSVWEMGLYAPASSGLKSDVETAIRTSGYLAADVEKVTCLDGYHMFLCAYQDGTFVGAWHTENEEFATSIPYSTELDISELRNAYPDYEYKLVVRQTTTGTMTVDEAENVVFTKSVTYYRFATSEEHQAVAEQVSQLTEALTETVTEEFTDVNLWELGMYAPASNGVKLDVSTAIRTTNYLATDVAKVTCLDGYHMFLCAYQGGTFVGAWDNETFATSAHYNTELNIAELRNAHPEYDFMLVVRQTTTGEMTVDEAVNVVFTTSETNYTFVSSKARDDIFIGFTDESLSEIINVDSNVTYIKITERKHNSISVNGVDGDNRIPLLMQSVDTGASAFYVSYTGIYKINTKGYSQIEICRENENFTCNVYLVDEKNVVFSNIEKIPPTATPVLKHGYTEFEAEGVTVWGARNGKLLATKVNNGLELYECDPDTGEMTNVGTTIYPYGGANALQCEILDDGTVMFLLNGGRVVRSTDLDTWTDVHDLGSGHAYIYGSFRQIDHYKNIVLLSEYLLPANYEDESDDGGRCLYLSTDYGETFTEIFNLVDYVPSFVKAHIHSIAYDPYEDMIWLVTGDVYSMIYYSKDMGQTWYQATADFKDCDVQMTSIIPLPDCVLFGSDCPILGVARYNRPTTGVQEGIDMHFDFPFYLTPRYIGTVPVASRPAIDYERGIAYFGYTVSTPGEQGLVTHGEVYATNGHVFKEVYKADEEITLGTVAVYGDFENNRCVAKHGTAGRWVNIKTKATQ